MAGGGGKANKHHHDGAAIVPKYYTELLSSYLGQRYNNQAPATVPVCFNFFGDVFF